MIPPDRPYLGHGVGLRVPHYARALAAPLDVDLVEAISENFFGAGGRPLAVLEAVRRDLPVVLHGVSLGIGSIEPPRADYLARLRRLVDRIEPAWVSDHLCWGYTALHFAHDLLPLPYTEEALAHVVERVALVQDVLGSRLVLENVSSYVAFAASTMAEHDFLPEVARRADCLILLDVNNVLVAAKNFGIDPLAYVDALPCERVWQLHLANAQDRGHYKFDDHRGPVPDEVWRLFEAVLQRLGPLTSIVEWDEDVPSWERLRDEQRTASARAAAVLDRAGASTPPQPVARPRTLARDAGSTCDLRATQALMWRAIVHPTGVDDFLARADASTRERFATTFETSPAWDRAARVGVYAEAYFWRLFEVLADQFELVAWLCGTTRFNDLVVDYVLACPSIDPDLRRFGARFPAFVAAHAEAERIVGIGDVADVEWAILAAVDAADDAVLQTAALAEIPLETWPQLRLHARASTAVVGCRLPFVRLWHAHAAGELPPSSAVLASARGDHPVLTFREGLDVFHRAISPLEARVLAAIVRGEPFGAACDAVADAAAVPRRRAAPTDIARWLHAWLRAGLFTRIA